VIQSHAKQMLESLTGRAREVKCRLDEACDDGTDVPNLVRESEAVQSDLSQWIADIRAVQAAQESGKVSFKVLNLPQWPKARFQAWLTRHKIKVQAR
jgi:hypothetical protein